MLPINRGRHVFDVASNRARRPSDDQRRDVLRSSRDHGPRGPGGGSKATRDVRRIYGTDRSPPPGLGGGRQLSRRGDGRSLHPHRGNNPGRRWLPGQRRWTGYPGGGPSPARGSQRRRGCVHHAARGRQIRWRWLQGLRWPSRCGHLGGERPLSPGGGGDRPRWTALLHGLRRRGPIGHPTSRGGRRPRGADRYQRAILARPRGLRRDPLQGPDVVGKIPDDGIPQPGAGDLFP